MNALCDWWFLVQCLTYLTSFIMFIFLVFCISIQQTILHSYNTLANVNKNKTKEEIAKSAKKRSGCDKCNHWRHHTRCERDEKPQKISRKETKEYKNDNLMHLERRWHRNCDLYVREAFDVVRLMDLLQTLSTNCVGMIFKSRFQICYRIQILMKFNLSIAVNEYVS